jgi:hypothetical protein
MLTETVADVYGMPPNALDETTRHRDIFITRMPAESREVRFTVFSDFLISPHLQRRSFLLLKSLCTVGMRDNIQAD